jgi:ribosomal protein S18 acetylase RimI-like enzyme
LITTNDNLRAIGFYQRLGYQLVNVYPNAVEKSRKIKSEIPLIA